MATHKPIKIAVFGAGHLGKIHIKCILSSPVFELVGIYDTNTEYATTISAMFGTKAWDNPAALIEAAELIDIVTPTISHFEIGIAALRAKRHIFIEKPITHTLSEALLLVQMATAIGVKAQVGHVERYNPAFLALEGQTLHPKFVEVHRLSTFNPRGTDVSVVLDLMIHDIDILLFLVKSPVKRIFANGVSIVSDSADIANARIEFENGCVANLTASRISLKQMRKMRLFQSDAYISMDFLEKKAEIIKIYDETAAKSLDIPLLSLDTNTGTKYIAATFPEVPPINAIQTELEDLARSIQADLPVTVSLQDGYDALQIALQIMQAIDDNTQNKA